MWKPAEVHEVPRPLSRRSFLTLAGAAGVGLALEACSSGSTKPAAGSTTTAGPTPSTGATTTAEATTAATATTAGATTAGATTAAATTTTASAPSSAAASFVVRKAGQRPYPSQPEGTERYPQIEHVVVVMMENHSFDNYLGLLGRGDGFTLGADGRPTNTTVGADGAPVKAFHMADTCQFPTRPSQAWNATHAQWNHGAMDGFARSDSGPVAMGYWTAADLPFYASLASAFPVCDRWFASCMGQTYPNRRFLLAATARGNIRTESATLSDPPPPNGTIMEALNRHGISWKNYFTSLPSTGLYLPVLATNKDKVVKIDRFYADAASGNLPAFSLVEPDFDKASEENPDDISTGEAFVAKVVHAVMASPAWPTTLLIWLYDEHGGYYDHVAPPPAIAPDSVGPKLLPGDVPGDYAIYGLRVPAVVVSPWARKDYVSHEVHDHTSILSFLEHKYNLPALTDRDGAADNLLDCLDLTGPPAFLQPPALAEPRNASLTTPLCTAPGPVPNPTG